MKTILLKLILLLSITSTIGINYISNTYAEEPGTDTVQVIVTESIPGAGCYAINSEGKEGYITKEEIKEGKTQMYKCEIQKGFKSVIIMMGSIIKYFTFIASLGAVLFIILNGILYSMGGAEPSMKDDAKKRIIGTLTGLILLLLSGVILNAIAPWIYK